MMAVGALAAPLAWSVGSVAYEGCTYEPPVEGEAGVITQSGGLATRQVGQLRLSAKPRAVVLKDTDCDEDSPPGQCIKYSLSGYFADLRTYAVRVRYHEGGGAMLVSRTTGARKLLNGYPWRSPDGDRLVTVTGDEAGFEFNGIEVWTTSASSLRREWRYEHKPARDRAQNYWNQQSGGQP